MRRWGQAGGIICNILYGRDGYRTVAERERNRVSERETEIKGPRPFYA